MQYILQFKAQVAIPGVEDNLSDVKIRVPTNSLILNYLLGGGVPSGRVMEIFGDPSHGKSSIVEEMIHILKIALSNSVDPTGLTTQVLTPKTSSSDLYLRCGNVSIMMIPAP